MSTHAKAGLAVVAVPLILLLLLVTVVVMMAGVPAAQADCTAGGSTPALTVDGRNLPTSVAGYSGTQLENAALIMRAAQTKGLSEHAQTLGVMTAMGEADLTVLGHGDAAGPDSRGLFQQRDNGSWGSLADRMNPTISAGNFFAALTTVPNWQTLPPTLAAHNVQGNADPYYYAPFWDRAVQVVHALAGVPVTTAAGTTSGAGSSTCAASGAVNNAAVTPGGWANPMPGATLTQRWCVSNGHEACHPGIDLASPDGTPMLAVHPGTVIFAGSAQGYGDHYICVDIGGGLISCYGHGQAQMVQVGDHVQAGQPVGLEGAEGYASGPHLHFEIRAGLWGPTQDPIAFLAGHGVKVP